MQIKIHDMIGPRCIIKEDGQRVYDAIHEPLKNGEEVKLNFVGVAQLASPFFNFAIGQLLKDITEDNLKQFLHIENIVPEGRMVIDCVIENASQYHTDVDYRKIVDSILEQQAKESE
jgi:hypothetical protein